jgi:hypothetical protein
MRGEEEGMAPLEAAASGLHGAAELEHLTTKKIVCVGGEGVGWLQLQLSVCPFKIRHVTPHTNTLTARATKSQDFELFPTVARWAWGEREEGRGQH